MNKRIKKKKAKQAELKRQQELEQLLQNPEQVFQALQSLCVALSNVFKNAFHTLIIFVELFNC